MKIRTAGLTLAALSLSATALAQTSGFAAAMDAAMSRMHAAMMSGHSDDADRDFAKLMIPHHQGAIEMADIELRYGKDERLRRLAQGIIVEQRQEIAVMREILGAEDALPAATAPSSSAHSTEGLHP